MMYNRFSQFGYFSIPSEEDKCCENITECFNLSNDHDSAAVILCAHDGIEVSKIILHNLKSALKSSLFTGLTDNLDIKSYLEDVFISFDKKYLKDADQYLRKRGLLNERLSKVELDTEIEDLYKSLEELERISKCGCTLSIAVLLNDRLHIAHIGDNEIIIAMDDEIGGEYKFLLLTEEHNFYNDDEIQRIKNECELNANGLRNLYGKSYAKYHSRCLGHFEMKYEYMQIETFRHAKSPPIICVPQITDGFKMNPKWRYLLFVSSGLYYLVMELIYDRDKIHGEIANEFFMTKKKYPNKNLSEISQLVISKYLNIYKAAFEEESNFNELNFNKIDHGELTIMAVKLSQPSTVILSDYGSDSIEIDENTSEPFDIQISNFPYPYVSFNAWYDAESKLSIEELKKFDSIFSMSKNDPNFILEEESSSSSKFSQTTTLEENVSTNDKNNELLNDNELISNVVLCDYISKSIEVQTNEVD